MLFQNLLINVYLKTKKKNKENHTAITYLYSNVPSNFLSAYNFKISKKSKMKKSCELYSLTDSSMFKLKNNRS